MGDFHRGVRAFSPGGCMAAAATGLRFFTSVDRLAVGTTKNVNMRIHPNINLWHYRIRKLKKRRIVGVMGMGAGVIFIGTCTRFRRERCMAAAATDLRFFHSVDRLAMRTSKNVTVKVIL